MPKVWRILSIDGGGTRGIIPATILASIEERTGTPICKLFDLIAGTSTGAILALGLTKPNAEGEPDVTAEQLCHLYDREIPNIFADPQSWWGNLLRPKYRSFAFQRVLQEYFGSNRLKGALTDVLIPCYDIEHRLPFMFSSRSARQNNECDFQMRDVALAACSSPTLFHPVRFPRSRAAGRLICLVDGGVFANNPSVAAFSEVKSIAPNEGDKYFIVSLGTGKSSKPLSDEFVSLWGYVQWSRPMLELVMESISEAVHEQMIHLLQSTDSPQYFRLQVELPDTIDSAIDNAGAKHLRDVTNAAREFCSDRQSGPLLDKVSLQLLRLSDQQAAAAGDVQS